MRGRNGARTKLITYQRWPPDQGAFMTECKTGALAGTTALITGGSRGIGLATAKALVARGARVCITARKEPGLKDAAAELGDEGVVLTVAGSTTDPEHRAHAVAATIERFGALDVLVNCAGVNPVYGPLADADLATIERVLAANVLAPLGWVQAAQRAWLAEHGGVIVNVGSVAAVRAQLGLGAYATSKAALLHMTRQLAYELGPRVRVNAVLPALVRTRFAEALWSNEAELLRHYPLGRLGMPEDVAEAIVFLASPQAAWITGESLTVDGGMLVNDSVSVPVR
jgi:NAD(P)-dependent dehydrogenase (short-subunit alcohol dehydrogenase family)